MELSVLSIKRFWKSLDWPDALDLSQTSKIAKFFLAEHRKFEFIFAIVGQRIAGNLCTIDYCRLRSSCKAAYIKLPKHKIHLQFESIVQRGIEILGSFDWADFATINYPLALNSERRWLESFSITGPGRLIRVEGHLLFPSRRFSTRDALAGVTFHIPAEQVLEAQVIIGGQVISSCNQYSKLIDWKLHDPLFNIPLLLNNANDGLLYHYLEIKSNCPVDIHIVEFSPTRSHEVDGTKRNWVINQSQFGPYVTGLCTLSRGMILGHSN